MAVFVCKQCGVAFVETNGAKRKYCSPQCLHASNCRLQDIQCANCSKTFRPESSRKRFCCRKCSHQCSNIIGVTSKQPQASLLGTEMIKCVNGNKEWMVFVGGGRGKRKWKRKAIIVAEQMLGRKLIGGELRIRFLDGDRLNCNIENLWVPPRCHLRVCAKCGHLKASVVDNSKVTGPTVTRGRMTFTFRRHSPIPAFLPRLRKQRSKCLSDGLQRQMIRQTASRILRLVVA